MLPHVFAVMQQFPFSAQRPGITYAAVQPVSWNEASVLERRFSPGIAPEEAMVVAADLIHDRKPDPHTALLGQPGQALRMLA